jgi:hypothetical protein
MDRCLTKRRVLAQYFNLDGQCGIVFPPGVLERLRTSIDQVLTAQTVTPKTEKPQGIAEALTANFSGMAMWRLLISQRSVQQRAPSLQRKENAPAPNVA